MGVCVLERLLELPIRAACEFEAVKAAEQDVPPRAPLLRTVHAQTLPRISPGLLHVIGSFNIPLSPLQSMHASYNVG